MANITWDAATKTSGITLSADALTATTTVSTTNWVIGPTGQAAGKFYFEITLNGAGLPFQIGLTKPAASYSSSAYFQNNGVVLNVGSTTESVTIAGLSVVSTSAYGAVSPALAAGSIVCVAVDFAAQLIWFRAGVTANWNGTTNGNPATGTGGFSFAALGAKGISLVPCLLTSSAQSDTANFGDSAFSGAVPTGFTSGWPTGGADNALVTQVSAEVWRVAPSDARFTYVGVEVWRSVQIGATPGSGTITFTGGTPISTVDAISLPGTGTITFTGGTPVSRVDMISSPGSGAITFTGSSAAPLTQSEVTSGSIVFAGQPVASVVEAFGSETYVCVMQ